jgi:hypothetical protein
MAARAFISPAGERTGAPRGKPRGNKAFALIQVHKGGAVYAAFLRCQASVEEFVTSPRQARSALNEARALYGVVAIHQLDAEPFGLRVHHQRIARGQANECVASRLLVQMSAGHIQNDFA